MASKTQSMVTLRLYRSLLRAAKPFTAPSPHARVINCLLSRTGTDDHISDWKAFVSATPKKEQAEDLSQEYQIGDNSTKSNKEVEVIPPNRTHQRLFRQLLREVVCGGDQDGIAKSTWPSLVNPTILWNIIRREFRDGPLSLSVYFDTTTRRQVAFRALRELNKKLCFLDYLEKSSPHSLPHQAARHVSRLPFTPSSEYLRPGTFLLAHPNMTGESFFSKAVICILEHDDKSQKLEDSNEDDRATKRNINLPGLQTYGLIVNRPSIHTDTGRNRTLKESFEKHMLPGRLADVFGDSVVREGGPVHVALQMLHSLPTSTATVEGSNDPKSIGGRVIPKVPNGDDNDTAVHSERSIYYQGEIFKAMTAVEDGRMDHDDVSFFVGASTWSIGQLRREVAEGFWIPCRGPPEIALTGICEHDGYSNDTKRPLADLWLSMMSACGEDEAKLAHLYYHVDETHEFGLPCDLFDKGSVDDY